MSCTGRARTGIFPVKTICGQEDEPRLRDDERGGLRFGEFRSRAPLRRTSRAIREPPADAGSAWRRADIPVRPVS